MPWPTLLHKYVGNENDDVWSAVIERAKSHPEEVGVQGAGYGQTALHAACYRYPPEAAIRVLIDACPEAASAQNSDGETALHLASDGASEQVQMMLLEACPDAVSKFDKYGDSPLHLAAHSGSSTELLKKMLEASPETVKVANKRGATPFFLLSKVYEYAKTREDIEEGGEYCDDWERVTMFLKATYFGSIEVPKGRKFYFLHAAASVKCPRILIHTASRLFPEQATLRDENGRTPLAIAASATIFQEPDIESTDDFYEGQYDFDVTPRNEYTGPNNVTNVHYLSDVEQFSSITNQVPDGYLGLCGEGSLISEHQLDSMGSSLSCLQDQGSDKETFYQPKLSQKPSVIDILVGLNPRAAMIPDGEGRLPFILAVESGKLWDEGLRSLLWAAPQSLSTRDTKTGMYPFMIAAVEHNASETTVYELIRLLPELVSVGIPQENEARISLTKETETGKTKIRERNLDQSTSVCKKRKHEIASFHSPPTGIKKSTIVNEQMKLPLERKCPLRIGTFEQPIKKPKALGCQI